MPIHVTYANKGANDDKVWSRLRGRPLVRRPSVTRRADTIVSHFEPGYRRARHDAYQRAKNSQVVSQVRSLLDVAFHSNVASFNHRGDSRERTKRNVSRVANLSALSLAYATHGAQSSRFGINSDVKLEYLAIYFHYYLFSFIIYLISHAYNYSSEMNKKQKYFAKYLICVSCLDKI